MSPLSPTTLSLVDTFSGQIVNFIKDISDEVKQAVSDGLRRYESNQCNKYLHTKTFLCQNETVNFYDVYFPLRIKHGKKEIALNNIDVLFTKTNYVSIIGGAGSGKTMLLKYLFLESLRKGSKIPVVVELRSLNNFDGDIFAYIHHILFNNDIAVNDKILERMLKDGSFTFLFDGYDEIYSETKEKVINDIDLFIDKYYQNHFIITSRPHAGLESLERFENHNVCPLTPMQVNDFIKQQIRHFDERELLTERIITAIEDPKNSMYSSYLSNPLLLSMFILTFETYPELPKTRSKFYWNVFDTLCTKHDSITKKGGFLHERKTSLQNQELKDILELFSYISLFQGKYVFDAEYLKNTLEKIKDKHGYEYNIEDLIYDLTVSVSILVRDGLEYVFPHKSLQEYFAALLISKQPNSSKKIIYGEKLDALPTHMAEIGNYYSLLYEIDKIPFITYFIKPKLDHIRDEVLKGTDQEVFFKYCKHLNLRISFDDNYRVKRVGISSNSIQLLSNILNFHYIPRLFISFGDNFAAIKLLDKILRENNIIKRDKFYDMNLHDSFFNQQDLYDFCLDAGIEDIVFQHIDEIKKEYNRVMSELEQEKAKADSILELA